MSRKNVFITIAVVLVAGAVVGANLYFKTRVCPSPPT
jgi:hypothetical protein